MKRSKHRQSEDSSGSDSTHVTLKNTEIDIRVQWIQLHGIVLPDDDDWLLVRRKATKIDFRSQWKQLHGIVLPDAWLPVDDN